MKTQTDYEQKRMYFTNNYRYAIRLQKDNASFSAYNFNSMFKVPECLNFDYVVCTSDDYKMFSMTFEER